MPSHSCPARVSWGQLPAGQVFPLEVVPSLCCSKDWQAPAAGRSDSQQIPGWTKPRKHSRLLLFISNIWHWGETWGLCSGSLTYPPALPLPSWEASDKRLDWCLSFPIWPWDRTWQVVTESVSRSVVSNSLWPHGLQPTRFLCPWVFSRQEYWRGLPFPSPGDLPDLGIKPASPALQADSLLLSHQGSP